MRIIGAIIALMLFMLPIIFQKMNSVKRIVGVALVNNLRVPCEGNIEILNIDQIHNTAYASWKFFDENAQLLASKTRNYHLDKENITETNIIEAVLENIMNYRIGRNHVFFEVKIP